MIKLKIINLKIKEEKILDHLRFNIRDFVKDWFEEDTDVPFMSEVS